MDLVADNRGVDRQHARDENLIERNGELERSLAERSRFIADLSHELRSPLHAIIGLAEVLTTSSVLQNEERRQVESITHEATALRVMIDSLLDFSKIDANGMELLAEPFSPAAVLDGVGQSHVAAALAKGLELSIEIDAALPRLVLGDEYRLRQVIVNLVTNAIKYTERGSVMIAARLMPAEPKASERLHHLRFCIRDSGPGIPSSAAETLFEPYRQARTAHSSKGTGLGLAISKSLVEMMGGTLTFETSPDGTNFMCEIPFLPAERADDRAPATAGATEQSTRPTGPAVSVLVVDDSDVNRMLAESQLERLGHRATLAASGEEALAFLAQQTFDVVLMDWHMPGMDGLETTRRIRANEPAGERMVIVATTASATSGDRDTCLAAGMDDYLAKPVSLGELGLTIERWTPQDESATKDPDASVDGDTIDRLVEDLGDRQIVGTVIETFLGELTTHCTAIHDSIRGRDLAVVTRAAHTLKSTATMLGANTLAACCAALEAAGRNDAPDADELAQLAAELTEAADSAATELDQRRLLLLTDGR